MEKNKKLERDSSYPSLTGEDQLNLSEKELSRLYESLKLDQKLLAQSRKAILESQMLLLSTNNSRILASLNFSMECSGSDNSKKKKG